LQPEKPSGSFSPAVDIKKCRKHEELASGISCGNGQPEPDFGGGPVWSACL
jgi:hypothetical protein